MKLRTIAFRNLLRRKAKALFILVGLLIGIASVVAFISLVEALTQEINHKMEKYGANILIVPKTESLSLTYGGISLGGLSFDMRELKQADLEKIKTIKNRQNVAAIGPLVLGAVEVHKKQLLLTGLDFQVRRFLRPWWKTAGRFPEKEEMLAGSEAARILGLTEGRTVTLNGQTLRVSGILEATGSQDDQMIFSHLTTAQAILGKEGRISMAEVAALCSGCPVEEMVAQIAAVLPGAKVMAIKQVVQSRMEALGHFQNLAFILSGLVILVGALVVLVTMMGSVRERTSEIGIFRSIGFRRSHVMRIILLEAGVVSLLAGALGYLVGLGVTQATLPFFSDGHGLTAPFNPLVAGGAVALALVLGLLSGIYPALMAARLDPNEALRSL
jgi:putative ABC transport system permease protein